MCLLLFNSFAYWFVFSSDRTTYELQLEYWSSASSTSVAAASSTSTSVSIGGGPLPGFSGVASLGGSGTNLMGTSVDRNSTLRLVTSKVICRALVVALRSSLTSNYFQQKSATPQKSLTSAQPQLNLALLTREKKPKSWFNIKVLL